MLPSVETGRNYSIPTRSPPEFSKSLVLKFPQPMSPPLKEYRETKHEVYLDALRGYAISGVFLAHFFRCHRLELPVMLNAVGHGVTLFYILSAYCLMLSLARSQQTPNLTDYGIRRFFRIAPAFYLAIAVWNSIPLPDGHARADTFLLLTSISFTNGFFPSSIHSAIPHGWSIAVETSFYFLLIPLFYYIDSLFSAARLLMIALPLSLGISWGLPYLAVRWGGGASRRQHGLLATRTPSVLPVGNCILLCGVPKIRNR